jgi:N-acetylmuramoyl-L-alanine amidase
MSNTLSFKKILIIKISLFLFPLFLSAQSEQSYYESKLETYFSKDHAVRNFIAITNEGISLYADASAKEAGKRAEIKLNWKEVDSLKNIISYTSERELEKILFEKKDSLSFYIRKDTLRHTTAKSLKGMKIAIDAGHIGGTFDMGGVESRCMSLCIDSAHQIKLEEGNLTFFTAQYLKKKLEAQGAVVILSRPDTGVSSIGISFYEWKRRIKNRTYVDSLLKEGLMTEKEAGMLHNKLADRALFSDVFGPMDLSGRARKINAFKPDITVVIHYNVNEKNTGWTKTTDKDFVMAFVGGCITTKDLTTLAGRLTFLRLLISNDIENSLKLCSYTVNHLSTDLKVPIVKRSDATYLSEHCLSTPVEGVYSRDLALTRMIKGPLVYGEPLYQDNANECVMLLGCGDKIAGVNTPTRIELVADAYYKAIEDYVAGLGK